MRRILVIDDERVAAAGSLFAALESGAVELIDHVRTSEDALGALGPGWRWDEIWFDHDLGGEDTTRPVVMHLAQAAHDGALTYGQMGCAMIVHTANPVGRDWVYYTLRRWFDVYKVDASSCGLIKMDESLLTNRP